MNKKAEALKIAIGLIIMLVIIFIVYRFTFGAGGTAGGIAGTLQVKNQCMADFKLIDPDICKTFEECGEEAYCCDIFPDDDVEMYKTVKGKLEPNSQFNGCCIPESRKEECPTPPE